MLVYMCACRLRLCVRSGLRLRLTHHLSRHPTSPPCSAGGGCRRCVVISRAGAGCSGERRPLSAVDWRGLALLALLGPDWGVGAFGSPGPGPVRPGVVSCRWRACGLAATAPWGAYTVAVGGPAFGLSSAFLGGGRGFPCGGSPGGSRPCGASDVLGPGLFRACFMPCGMGLLFPTHTIKRLHGGTL